MTTLPCGCVQEGDDLFYERICRDHAPAWDYWGPKNTLWATAGRIMGRKRRYVAEHPGRRVPSKVGTEAPPPKQEPVPLAPVVPWTPEVMAPEALERAMEHGSWSGWVRHLQQRQLGYAHDGVRSPPTPEEDAVRKRALLDMANRNTRIEQSRRQSLARARSKPTAAEVRANTPVIIGAWPNWPGGPKAGKPPKPSPNRRNRGGALERVRPLMAEGMDCRVCGEFHRHIGVEPKTGLVLGHIKARALGGSDGAANRAIVCRKCDDEMGCSDWTGRLPSVSTEIGKKKIVLPKA